MKAIKDAKSQLARKHAGKRKRPPLKAQRATRQVTAGTPVKGKR